MSRDDKVRAGRAQGLKNARVPGFLSRIGRLGSREDKVRAGRLGGKVAVESGRLALLRTTEHQIEAGKAAGALAVRSGQIQELVRRNAENGHLERITTRESCSKGGQMTNHLRWHVKRDRVNPRCLLCCLAEEV